VIAAAADKACEVLGAGCLEPHVACLSYGTTATINTTHRRYVEPLPLLPPYPSAVPGAYSLEIQIYRGFWMVTWFKEQFGQLEEAEAREKGLPAEALFDELVSKVPSRFDGPRAAALLVARREGGPGLRRRGPSSASATSTPARTSTGRSWKGSPTPSAKGRSARRSGAASRSRSCASRAEDAQSDAAMQITADVFGLPAARPHVTEASGLGAAIDVAVGLGLHPTFESAVASMTRVGRVFVPDPSTSGLYDRLYRRVYRRMYERLRPSTPRSATSPGIRRDGPGAELNAPGRDATVAPRAAPGRVARTRRAVPGQDKTTRKGASHALALPRPGRSPRGGVGRRPEVHRRLPPPLPSLLVAASMAGSVVLLGVGGPLDPDRDGLRRLGRDRRARRGRARSPSLRRAASAARALFVALLVVAIAG
jgi:Sugar (pentulose and hexulose) kinases